MKQIGSLVPYKIMPPVKGGERHVFFYLKHLSDFTQLTCCTVRENEKLMRQFATLPVLGSQGNRLRYINPFLYFSVSKALKERGVRNLIIEHPYFGWLGLLLQRFSGIACIVRSHNIESYRFRSLGKWWWRILYYYEKWIHQQAHLNFFITPEDRAFAIENFLLDPDKCIVSTYGVDLKRISTAEKRIFKEKICLENNIDPATSLLLFNGALDYKPNSDAIDRIVAEIIPRLKKAGFANFKVVICGKGLPAAYQQLKRHPDILFKGFVPDIHEYFCGANVFINPITQGGGIKTKLVEALGSNTPAVSFVTGAYGIPTAIAGTGLKVIADEDDTGFAEAILEVLKDPSIETPDSFYAYFNWDKIAQTSVEFIRAHERINS